MSDDFVVSEDFVIEALKSLREADQDREAGPRIEARLLEEVRRSKTRRILGFAGAWTAAAAAVAAVVVLSAGRPVPPREEPRVEAPAVSPTVTPSPSQSAPVSMQPVKPAPRNPQVHGQPVPVRQVATQFYSLMDVQPPFDRGQLVTVVLPASAMRDVGLPVRDDQLSDPVEAQVLVGQEGLPRAIRFLRSQK